ncbi:MAG: response regulator [Verrucomicrobia bacterium]|nr:response regulator [Verrucomicrobiota bacterium]
MQNAKILIIDDESVIINTLKAVLHRANYANLFSTTDSREAALVFAQYKPDLVLLDMNMPHLDGLGVLTQLNRLITPGTYLPILVLTGYCPGESKQRAFEAGAKDFLNKPFDNYELIARVRNLLETRSLHLELNRCKQALADLTRASAPELQDALA